MKLVLKNGIDVECNVDEFVALEKKGFLDEKVKPKRVPNLFAPEKPLNLFATDKPVKSMTHKRFRKFEDKIMLDMWARRKNKMKLNSKEYNELLQLMPGRTRSSLCNRMFKLRHDLEKNKVF